jgi:hypothetical protein
MGRSVGDLDQVPVLDIMELSSICPSYFYTLTDDPRYLPEGKHDRSIDEDHRGQDLRLLGSANVSEENLDIRNSVRDGPVIVWCKLNLHKQGVLVKSIAEINQPKSWKHL